MASSAQRAGLDAAALRAGGPSDAELDALYEQYTQDALKAGVFGAPSYVLPSGEIFWGQDRLELLERALKLRLSAILNCRPREAGTQYAAAYRFYRVSGILGRPVKPGDDSVAHISKTRPGLRM